MCTFPVTCVLFGSPVLLAVIVSTSKFLTTVGFTVMIGAACDGRWQNCRRFKAVARAMMLLICISTERKATINTYSKHRAK